jgi:sodium/potassium/calcium exchanger 6
MYNLSSTADEYLSPALEYLTLKFGISESLAGVTLLAFGNGAPDVFSSLNASN